jgi:hypothetical protein
LDQSYNRGLTNDEAKQNHDGKQQKFYMITLAL